VIIKDKCESNLLLSTSRVFILSLYLGFFEDRWRWDTEAILHSGLDLRDPANTLGSQVASPPHSWSGWTVTGDHTLVFMLALGPVVWRQLLHSDPHTDMCMPGREPSPSKGLERTSTRGQDRRRAWLDEYTDQ